MADAHEDDDRVIHPNTTSARWFVDTDYNAESFFVHLAYFTSARELYDMIKRALRAEIDEVAWASLYRT